MADFFTNTSDDFYCEGGPDFTLTQYRVQPGGAPVAANGLLVRTRVEGGCGLTIANSGSMFSDKEFATGSKSGSQAKFVVKEDGKLIVGLEGPLSEVKPELEPLAFVKKVSYNVAATRIGTTPKGTDLISYRNDNTVVLDKANIVMDTSLGYVTVGKSDQIYATENYKTLGYAGAGTTHATPNWGIVYETKDMMGLKMKMGAQLLSTDYNVHKKAILKGLNTVIADQPALQASLKYDINNFAGFLNGSMSGSYFTSGPKTAYQVTANETDAGAPATAITGTTTARMNGADVCLKFDFGKSLETSFGYAQGQNIGMNNLLQGSALTSKPVKSFFAKISTPIPSEESVKAMEMEMDAHDIEPQAEAESWMSWLASPVSWLAAPVRKIGFSVDFGQTTNDEVGTNLLSTDKSAGAITAATTLNSLQPGPEVAGNGAIIAQVSRKNTCVGGHLSMPVGKFESRLKYRQWTTESGGGFQTDKVREVGIGARCSF